jgi:phosphoserine phosphatase
MVKQTKVIAIELDQVLACTIQAMTHWHKETYDKALSISDSTTAVYTLFGAHEEANVKMRKFYDSSNFQNLKPINDEALEVLKYIKKQGHLLVIITWRPQFIAEQTRKFVDRHYPGKT